MIIFNSEFQHRHRDDEFYDEVQIKLVERWKTSGPSGDEWRFCYKVELKRKGFVIWTRAFGKLETAIAALLWFSKVAGELGGDEFDAKASEDTRHLCAQPGCQQLPAHKYYLKKQYSREGYSEDPTSPMFICFCEKHKTRGDCGLEDADDNYTKEAPEAA